MTTETLLTEKPTLTNDMIARVYSGKPGCACGCNGNYSDTKATITRILNLFRSAAKVFHAEGSNGESMYYWDREDGKRTYTIYTKAT